jgi:hypothetical protein
MLIGRPSADRTGAAGGERGSQDSARECQMRYPALRRSRLDLISPLQGLEAVSQPDAATEQDRHPRNVGVVDKPRSEEVTDDGRASADPHALALRGLAGHRERVGGRGINVVKVVPPSISIGRRV